MYCQDSIKHAVFKILYDSGYENYRLLRCDIV